MRTHTHRETGRQNHPSRDRLRRSTVSWLVDRNECRYRVGLAQARLDRAETNGHSEPERTKQSQSSPTRPEPYPVPGPGCRSLQSSVFFCVPFVFHMVFWSLSLPLPLPLTDVALPVALPVCRSVASVSVIGSPQYTAPVSAAVCSLCRHRCCFLCCRCYLGCHSAAQQRKLVEFSATFGSVRFCAWT